jgi:hypothetical protein
MVLKASAQYNKNVVWADHGVIPVGTYVAAFKPWRGLGAWDRNEEWAEKLIGPSIRAWRRKGFVPAFAANTGAYDKDGKYVDGKWSEGATVYLTRGRVEVCDDIHFDRPENIVGTIRKVGRKWHLDPTPEFMLRWSNEYDHGSKLDIRYPTFTLQYPSQQELEWEREQERREALNRYERGYY